MVPEDKIGHFNLGLILGLAFADFPLVAIGIVLGFAIGKEIFDYVSSTYFNLPHSVEFFDAFATLVGGAAGLAIRFGLKLFL